jgi:hypothetical protein
MPLHYLCYAQKEADMVASTNNQTLRTIQVKETRRNVAHPKAMLETQRALSRAEESYKTIYKESFRNNMALKPLINALSAISFTALQISLYPDGAKAKFSFGTKEFVVDYDFESRDSLFISSFNSRGLTIKECDPSALSETLRTF